jgi:hypothetical protein
MYVATPDATEMMLNPIRMIAAHTAKAKSDEFRRLSGEGREYLGAACVALGTDEGVNTVMFYFPWLRVLWLLDTG